MHRTKHVGSLNGAAPSRLETIANNHVTGSQKTGATQLGEEEFAAREGHGTWLDYLLCADEAISPYEEQFSREGWAKPGRAPESQQVQQKGHE